LRAETRLLGALSAGSGRRALGPARALFSQSVEVSDAAVAGIPATVARPVRGSAWPTVVFANGVTARGRFHPAVRRLAESLAAAGLRVVVPDPPGLATGALSVAMADGLAAVVADLAGDGAAAGGTVGLLGVSVGGTMALLVAEDMRVADRVSIVGALAPCTDLPNGIRLATTGVQLRRGRLVAYWPGPLMAMVAARSLLTALPAGAERERLLAAVPAVSDGGDPAEPLTALFQTARSGVSAAAESAVALLANHDPTRFDRLYGALPAGVRDQLDRLSPIRGAAALSCPVELAIGPHDTYFPVAEALDLARESPRVRVTVTPVLAHADSDLRRAGAGELLELHRLALRILRSIGGRP
jgi:pimeloyl-ACP methyl ester carboxylesterase